MDSQQRAKRLERANKRMKVVGTSVIGDMQVSLLLVGMAVTLIACSPEIQGLATEETVLTAVQNAPMPGLDRSVLDDPARPDAERTEDKGRKAIDVYEWLGMRPGMTAAVRSYHDLGGTARPEAVASMYRALKAGGVVGIVEVATDKLGWDPETHRLNEQTVIQEFTTGGFELSARSDMLENPADDRSTSGFEEGTFDGRYDTDRYLLKFTKPTN